MFNQYEYTCKSKVKDLKWTTQKNTFVNDITINLIGYDVVSLILSCIKTFYSKFYRPSFDKHQRFALFSLTDLSYLISDN